MKLLKINFNYSEGDRIDQDAMFQVLVNPKDNFATRFVYWSLNVKARNFVDPIDWEMRKAATRVGRMLLFRKGRQDNRYHWILTGPVIAPASE